MLFYLVEYALRTVEKSDDVVVVGALIACSGD